MIPERGRPLVVGVLEHRRARLPRHTPLALELGPEGLIPAPDPGIAPRDILGRRQIPGLREAVALLSVVSPVQMGHDRDWTGVRTRCAREGGACIPPLRASWRVG